MIMQAVQVDMLIWFPANLAVTVDDPVLNLIIPSASLSSVSNTCTTPLYQRSAVYATCDFTGGGTSITRVDITTLVTFTTSSSAYVSVTNNYVQVHLLLTPMHSCVAPSPCEQQMFRGCALV